MTNQQLYQQITNLLEQSDNLEIFLVSYTVSLRKGKLLKDNSLLFYPVFKDILRDKNKVINKLKEISTEYQNKLFEIEKNSKNIDLSEDSKRKIKIIKFNIRKCWNAYIN